MTISIRHAFTSLKGDGSDATFVQPTHWNAAHATSIASGNLVGRLAAGAGAFEEIPISAFMADILASGDVNVLATKLGLLSTGDVKFSISLTAPAGWLAYVGSGTIGNTGSTGTIMKSPLCYELFKVIWNNISDTYCPVVPAGRGATADADWTANKAIYLPTFSAKAIIGSGSTSGYTARAHGSTGGEENHILTVTELAKHRHSAALSDPQHYHSYNEAYDNYVGVRWFDSHYEKAVKASNTGNSYTGLRIYSSDGGYDTTYTTGDSTAHNNMQPWVALQVHVKL